MNGPSTTRYSLIAKLANRDDHVAWSEFLDLYHPLIYRFALSRGLQPTDAHEVTQEVLIRVSRAIEQFQQQTAGPKFRHWLYTIARNLTIDFLRKENRQNQRLQHKTDWQLVPAAESSQSDAFLLMYRREIFLAASRWIQPKVKPVNWQAFWQSEVLQLPAETVASQLGINRAAVYVARSRILSMFRKYVEEHTLQEDADED